MDERLVKKASTYTKQLKANIEILVSQIDKLKATGTTNTDDALSRPLKYWMILQRKKSWSDVTLPFFF
jgi:hypothetical protein